MTLKTAKKRHKELWDWLSKNPNKIKSQWPKWKYNGGKIKEIKSDCFLCVIAGDYCNNGKNCPVIWPEDVCCDYGPKKKLYQRYNAANDQERAELAAQIRDLPWKD